MRKTIRTIIINTFYLLSALVIFYIILLITLTPHPKFVIHKTINYAQYDIVIISIRGLHRFDCNRNLYADIWTNNEKILRYHLCHLDITYDYNDRLKHITFSPDNRKLLVEFMYPEHSKTRTGVDHYKLP